MPLEQYTIIPNVNTSSTQLFTATNNDISLLEKTFDITTDQDYKDYVTNHGCGILGGTYIRVYLPQVTMLLQKEWQERINQYWFWDEGKEVLTKDQALQSVVLGDTLDGDEIILFEQQYYVLPRHEEMIYKIGDTLGDAIAWLCSTGILTEAFVEREFEPFDPAEYRQQ
ncbi:SMI1/KNR4 family protein [Chitinophaga sp. Cy-1792]|uniref:SMI1/KNR4 family protein n=1 Tax=Chitinophaga sp. Cy-1792 TaxID=2608339 RepID=UPI001421CEBA|nr:SMI1/KNR4 family protein [Chitinophaga sp. Cy-1792]NIG55096.1 SMI1/KNR4 family protein [Chitinophaga sp. Cy-1792]